ncbi:MAG: hypothetical protein KA116_04405 [Proteobacteria bacterium]|nr:hypothetical protein [Pseudomonadota bacterium]
MNIKILCLCLFICTQTIAVESVVDQAPLPAMMVETLKSSEITVVGPDTLYLEGSTLIEGEHIIIKGNIVTRGNYLKIMARVLEIVEGTEIMAFDKPTVEHKIEKEKLKTPSQAPRETTGANGKTGDKGFKGNDGYYRPGSIEISAAVIIGRPKINANGEGGSSGGVGQNGQDGAQGGHGKDSTSTWGMFIKRRATDGAPGGNGGAPGEGGDGGQGGGAVPTTILYGKAYEWKEDEKGKLIFTELKAESISENVSTKPGQGGMGGKPGIGGKGGAGGQGGSGGNYFFGSAHGEDEGPSGKTSTEKGSVGNNGLIGPEVRREEVLKISNLFESVLNSFEDKEKSEKKFRLMHATDKFLQSFKDWANNRSDNSELDLELKQQILAKKNQLQAESSAMGLNDLSALFSEIKNESTSDRLSESVKSLEAYLNENYRPSLVDTVNSLKKMTLEITKVKDALKGDSNAFLDSARLFGSPLFENLTDLEKDPETLLLPPSLKRLSSTYLGSTGAVSVERKKDAQDKIRIIEKVLP